MKNRRSTQPARPGLRNPSWGLALLSLSLIQSALPGRADAWTKQQLPVVQLTGGPVQALTADGASPAETPPLLDGFGVCGAFRSEGTMNATAIFKENPTNIVINAEVFSGSVNTFMDASPRDRFDETLITLFDLSNNRLFTDESSRGDYTNPPDCRPLEPGCQFPGSLRSGADLDKGFGTRFRGYLRVPKEWVGPAVHLGFFVDRGVALKIWDLDRKTQKRSEHLVLSHSPDRVGKPFRVTNTVFFKEAGIYPIEITGASIRNSASTEFVYFIGDIGDIEDSVSSTPSPFTDPMMPWRRVPRTQFYQTLNGDAPYAYGDPKNYRPADVLLGQQCDARFADVPGRSLEPAVCDFENIPLDPPATRAHYCNSASVCAPCVVDTHCGVDCPACGPGQHCRLMKDGIRNDPRYYACNLCRNDAECPRGQLCDADGMCQTAPSCCPEGTRQIDIALKGTTDQPPHYICSECETDADCKDASKGVCDRENGRCIAAKPDCNTDDSCNVSGPNGAGCQPCKSVDPNRPYCLNGNNCVQCKSDNHCPDGQFCLSGQCTYCTQDAHCGPTCVRCPEAAPFCATTISDLNPRQPVDRKCVRCLSDEHCGEDGRCDQSTHQCVRTDTCDPTCPQGQFCLGDRCVGCFSNIHCGCGKFCDLETNTCQQGCKDTADCQGTQCCSRETNTCLAGRCAPGRVHGGYSCGCGMADIGSAQDDGAVPAAVKLAAQSRGTLLAGVATALLWVLLRRRRLSY